jgi:hypothetical protein
VYLLTHVFFVHLYLRDLNCCETIEECQVTVSFEFPRIRAQNLVGRDKFKLERHPIQYFVIIRARELLVGNVKICKRGATTLNLTIFNHQENSFLDQYLDSFSCFYKTVETLLNILGHKALQQIIEIATFFEKLIE